MTETGAAPISIPEAGRRARLAGPRLMFALAMVGAATAAHVANGRPTGFEARGTDDALWATGKAAP